MAAGDTALADLRASPVTWLHDNAVVMFGAGPSTHSGPQQCRIYKADPVVSGANWQSAAGGNLRTVPYWVIASIASYPHGPGQADAASASAAFDAHYVSMREYKNGAWEDANTTHYMLPGAGGADMMVTSKLNGCTFGMGSHSAGGRLVSHLRPPNQNPTTDAQVVSTGTEAGFVHRGDTVRATVNSSGEEQGTIIGFRMNGRWQFFVQRFQALPNRRYLISTAFRIG